MPTVQNTETAVMTANASSGDVEPDPEAASGMASTQPDTVESTIDNQNSSTVERGACDVREKESIVGDSTPPEPIRNEEVPPGLANTTLVKQDESPMHPPIQELTQQENGTAEDPRSIDAVSNNVSSNTLLDAIRPEPAQLKPDPAGSVSQWQSYAAKPPDFQVRQPISLYDKYVNIRVAFARRYGSYELFFSFGYCQGYLGSFQPRHQQPSSEG